MAVRSSATAEDTEAASFAGMNETFLNVRGADAVVEAVRAAGRRSSAHARSSTAQAGFGQAEMDIAVVVQRQIAVDAGGRDVHHRPGPGARDRLVIEGAFGLGEAVVGGQVVARPLRGRQGDAARHRPARCAEGLAIEAHPDGGR